MRKLLVTSHRGWELPSFPFWPSKCSGSGAVVGGCGRGSLRTHENPLAVDHDHSIEIVAVTASPN